MRKRFERFCFRNRDKGIPNLMLYIALGNAVVYLMSLFAGNTVLYETLCFDRALILQGQVWRLFTFVFTNYSASTNFLLAAVSMLCYFSLGRAIENVWGTCRFNLFYLTGVILIDLFAMIIGGIPVVIEGYSFDFSSYYSGMGTYLNLALFISYATMYPESQFLLLYIIPVKAWIFAVFDLFITLYDVFSMTFPINFFPHNLFPLVALANYFLFFGKEVLNVIPISWRANARRLFRKGKQTVSPTETKAKVVPFPTAGSYQASTATVKAPYTHKCTICGRTDVSHPDLEFRYCSRCNGYHCYCQDHISTHTHIE